MKDATEYGDWWEYHSANKADGADLPAAGFGPDAWTAPG